MADAPANLPSDPQQLALMFKKDIEAPGSNGQPYFTVQADGRVKAPNGAYVPPWSWATMLPGTRTPDEKGLTPLGDKLTRPGSDPQSAWSAMYEPGKPFRSGSQWDQKTGTYKGHINWGDLIVTGLAGGVIAGGVVAATAGGAAAGGGGAAATIPTTMGVTGAEFGGAAATSAVPAVVGGGTAAAAAAPVVAGTAPAVAPVVAGGAAKGGASWLTGNSANLISQGVGIAGNIYATKKQADAAEEAARLQNEQYDKALEAAKEEQTYNRAQTEEQKAYSRNQYADYLSRLNPYAQTGAASNDRLAAFMGQPSKPVPRADGGYSQPSMTGGPEPLIKHPIFTAGPTGPTSAPQVQLVKLAAPDGSVKDVPANEVPHWVQLGAKVVQGATA